MIHKIDETLEDIRQGKMVILSMTKIERMKAIFTMAAEKVTPEAINFMAIRKRADLPLPNR